MRVEENEDQENWTRKTNRPEAVNKKTGREIIPTGAVSKGGAEMCLSTVYKNEVNDANMLAKNVADIKVDGGKIIFTDLMGIRTTFDGTLEKVDLMENYVIVRG